MGKPGAALRAAGWVTVGVVAAGGVATAATTGSTSPGSGTVANAAVTAAGDTAANDTAAGATGAAKSKAGKRGALGKLRGRLLHGQFTVLGKDNKPVVLAEQRGTVADVSPTSLTLTSTDGFSQTYTLTPTTRVRIDGQKSSVSALKAGQTAGVLATVSGTTETAKAVIERAK